MRNVFKYFKLELIPEAGLYYAPYLPGKGPSLTPVHVELRYRITTSIDKLVINFNIKNE